MTQPVKPQVARSPECQTLTVEDAARILGIGRSAAYLAVRRGELPAIQIGRRYVVPRAALERLLTHAGEPASRHPVPDPAQ